MTITIPTQTGARWAVKADIQIAWDWTLIGLHWDMTPNQIKIYGTILPPFIMIITETRMPYTGHSYASTNH